MSKPRKSPIRIIISFATGIVAIGGALNFITGKQNLPEILNSIFPFEKASNETESVAHEHEPGDEEQENIIEPTCTESGSYDLVVYCEDCGEELSRETISTEALGHKTNTAKKENKIAATCTTSGSYDEVVYCKECGIEMSRNHVTVDPLEHNYVDGVCIKCKEIDINYASSSEGIAKSLFNHVTSKKGGYKSYSNGETVSVFAEDVTNAFIIQAQYNMWVDNIQYVTFNVNQLKENVPILYYTVDGQTDCTRSSNVTVYINGEETSGDLVDSYTVNSKSIPITRHIELQNAQSFISMLLQIVILLYFINFPQLNINYIFLSHHEEGFLFSILSIISFITFNSKHIEKK